MPKIKTYSLGLVLLGPLMIIIGCQKEIDFPPPPVVLKPKVGTRWIYQYNTYYSWGASSSSTEITYTATSEEEHGGEKWLNITDNAGVTVYLLQAKGDGLYIYANNKSYLLFKYPALVNDTYPSYYNGSEEDFIVKKINDTLALNDDYVCNYYEGIKKPTPPLSAVVNTKIWYDKSAWIVKQQLWAQSLFSPYYKRTSLELKDITY